MASLGKWYACRPGSAALNLFIRMGWGKGGGADMAKTAYVEAHRNMGHPRSALGPP